MTLAPILSAPASCCRPRSVLRDRHAIDLDVEGPGPLRHAEEDAGWGVFREVALVDFVEGLEPVRRDAQHIALQHMVEVRPGCLQRLLNLLQDQLNLALERGVDEDLAGLRIEGRHARDEHHVAGAGAGGHRRAPLLEIAVNRLDPDDLSFHASVSGPFVANLRVLRGFAEFMTPSSKGAPPGTPGPRAAWDRAIRTRR